MELKKIKLNKLSNNALAERQMKGLKGGNCCLCSCAYRDHGGSSVQDNKSANHQLGYNSRKTYPGNECDFEVQC